MQRNVYSPEAFLGLQKSFLNYKLIGPASGRTRDTVIVIYHTTVKKEPDGTRNVARVFLSSQRFNSGKRFFERVAT